MKKVLISLTKLYKKELNFYVDPELIEGKSDEEIADYLMEVYDYQEKDELLEEQELESIDFPDNHGYIDGVDSDRYDVFDEKGKQTYGGHL